MAARTSGAPARARCRRAAAAPCAPPSRVCSIWSPIPGRGPNRPIVSGINGERLSNAWKEFPQEWFEGLDIKTRVVRAPGSPNFVPGLPHVMITELRQALIWYQDYHMLLLTLAAGAFLLSAVFGGDRGSAPRTARAVTMPGTRLAPMHGESRRTPLPCCAAGRPVALVRRGCEHVRRQVWRCAPPLLHCMRLALASIAARPLRTRIPHTARPRAAR